RIRRVPERHRYFRPGSGCGIAAKEEKLVPRLHLTIGIAHARSALICRVGEPTRRVDVVAQPGPSSVEHTPWRIDCPDNLDARYVLRYVHGVTGLENHVVPRRRV